LISFVKAHACGNDFLIVEAKSMDEAEQRKLAVRLCARHTGLGADGIEFLKWGGEYTASIRLFNIDGSIAEISGNGTRCVAAWMAFKKDARPGEILKIETDAGTRECRIVEACGHSFEIAAAMGVPNVSSRRVTVSGGLTIEGAVVSMGNPHFVTFVDDRNFAISGREWESVGREICFHADFPHQTNVEFVRVVSPGEIDIRVFERGVGPTTSSGTGTCASAAAAIAVHGMQEELRVRARGGTQLVEWSRFSRSGPTEMTLTGPADLIAFGEAYP
jgi:diaminopimelate epimerase